MYGKDTFHTNITTTILMNEHFSQVIRNSNEEINIKLSKACRLSEKETRIPEYQNI